MLAFGHRARAAVARERHERGAVVRRVELAAEMRVPAGGGGEPGNRDADPLQQPQVRRTGQLWIDVGYQSAYLQLTRRFGDDALTARADVFATRDRTLKSLDNNEEQGWALTADWRHRLAEHAELLVEAMHVRSDRPGRAYAGEADEQDQTVLQTALRLTSSEQVRQQVRSHQAAPGPGCVLLPADDPDEQQGRNQRQQPPGTQAVQLLQIEPESRDGCRDGRRWWANARGPGPGARRRHRPRPP